MYSRDYKGKTINFEASGGLIHSSLVMQDQQTDSYWSIMKGEAIGGELAGTKLEELPLGEKMKWRDWRKQHPDTLVLSVNGREDGPNPYAGYFRDPEGFRGERARDDRLETKEPIYAFHHQGVAYAIRSKDLEKGRVLELEDGTAVLLHRRRGASLFESTDAFRSGAGFERRDGTWMEKASGATFDGKSGVFTGGSVERLSGVDTFWYNWSLNNPETRLLR